MRTYVTFRGFEGIDHLKSFVINTTRTAIEKYEGGLVSDTNLVLSAHHFYSREVPAVEYECEALIRGPNFDSPLIVKKRHSDFYLAVRSCLKSVDKILRRNSRLKATRRRRAYGSPLKVVNA